jgi:adenosylhomocysteine nucleosidase
MTLIVCALKLEVKPFLRVLKNKTVIKNNKIKLYQGEIDGIKVKLLICGVGLLKASNALSQIEINEIDSVLMSGTACAIDKKLKIGDTVISDEFVFHENISKNQEINNHTNNKLPISADTGLLNKASIALENNPPTHPHYVGRISSGSKFVSGKRYAKIAKEFDPLCSDMESAAVANVCCNRGLPFVAIRSISDTQEKSGFINFIRYASQAASNSFVVTRKILKSL